MSPSAANPALETSPRIPTKFDGVRVHLIGVGGSGMSGLAAMLLRRGGRVSGSDKTRSALLDQLSQSGAAIQYAQRADTFPPASDLVVASAAIPADHPEMIEAARLGIPVVKYAQMLGALMALQDGIAISGTHGKSTTTAWLTYTLQRAGLSPNFVVGAVARQCGGGSGCGDGRHFVAEACEYDRSFLNLRPRYAAILNIEEDHLDYYENLAAIQRAFAEFAALVPADGLIVLNGQDAGCRGVADQIGAPIETYGLSSEFDWGAIDLDLKDGNYSFTLTHHGRRFGRLALGLPGRHNVCNALAVVALAMRCGVDLEVLRAALQDFEGCGRRLDRRGTAGGITIVDDYAHHPTEIRATLQAARDRFGPGKLWCIFQPHQHSRTRFLLSDFARSFELADHVLLPDIYFVRDSQAEREAVSAQDLVERICAGGGDALHIPDFSAIVAHVVAHAEPGDLVLTMGAGDIWKVADELVQRLGGVLPG